MYHIPDSDYCHLHSHDAVLTPRAVSGLSGCGVVKTAVGLHAVAAVTKYGQLHIW